MSKKYKHTNLMESPTVLYDSKGKGHQLLSGESVILDLKKEVPGLIEVKELKPKKKIKSEDDKNDE